MTEQSNPRNDLPIIWAHTQSAIIAANSFQFWSLQPELMRDAGIPEPDWQCTRAIIDPSGAEIQFGPVLWTMTEQNLTIETTSATRLNESVEINGKAVIPLMMDRFLEFKPDLPISQVWFHWEAATLHPRPHDWITRTFTGLGWPDSLKPTRLLPELTVETDTHHVTIAISPQRLALGGNTSRQPSIRFNAWAFAKAQGSIASMIPSEATWKENANALENIIRALLEEKESL